MGKVLGSTVALHDPAEGRTVALLKGSVLPAWADGLVDESRLVDSDVPVEDVSEPAADPATPDPAKSIEDMTKDELLDEVATLREQGVELEVNSSSRKDDILDALRSYIEG